MPYGRIAVEWYLNNGKVCGCIEIPSGVNATLVLPNRKKECLRTGKNEVHLII